MSSSNAPLQRREVHYRGRVQGVGFRYTVRQIASRFAVIGFVRNLADGRVQMVAEGDAGALDDFLATVAVEMDRYLADARVSVQEPTGGFNGFEIRF